jgi:acetolactate synthase small subunit
MRETLSRSTAVMERIQLQQRLENLRNSINILPEDREYHIYRELILAQLTINQIKAPKSMAASKARVERTSAY